MGKATLQYLDKRDEQGVILRYSAHELAFDVSSKALDFIRSNDIYSFLVSKVPKKYIDLYYKKMIYEAFLPIVSPSCLYAYNYKGFYKMPGFELIGKEEREAVDKY